MTGLRLPLRQNRLYKSRSNRCLGTCLPHGFMYVHARVLAVCLNTWAQVTALPDITHATAARGDRLLIVCDGIVRTPYSYSYSYYYYLTSHHLRRHRANPASITAVLWVRGCTMFRYLFGPELSVTQSARSPFLHRRLTQRTDPLPLDLQICGGYL